jgi:hypothetical protein
MELSSEQINTVVQILDKADGEDVHHILKQSFWSKQMLKQLIMTEDIDNIEYWYQQRKVLEDEINKKFHLIGKIEYKTVIFDFEDDKNDYVVTYNEQGGWDNWTPTWSVVCDGTEVESIDLKNKLINLAKDEFIRLGQQDF